MSVKMSVNLGGLIMRNPVTVASGTFGSGKEFAEFYPLSELGAVTTKGVSLEPWSGNATPRIAETASGMLNSIGLQNSGVETFIEHDLAWLSTQDVPVIVNVCGEEPEGYMRVVEHLEKCATVAAYEINISCPNVEAGGMAFGADPACAHRVITACRSATKRPLFAKLSPNVTDIGEIAKAVEDAGADAISLINTLLSMAIDAKTRRPKLARIVGGLSGPAVKPVALRMVYQASGAVTIPVLGMGGIRTGEDAVEFLLAGAHDVAVGTANFVDPYAARDVARGIETYCEEEGVRDVSELIGGLRLD